jgi:bifunctional DNase/RNase
MRVRWTIGLSLTVPGLMVLKLMVLGLMVPGLSGCSIERPLDLEPLADARRRVETAQAEADLHEPRDVKLEGDAIKVPANANPAQPPPGYVEVKAHHASSPDFGNAVLLLDPMHGRVMPIYIGGTEGLSIGLRLKGKRYTRPLTHDLYDATLKELGAKLLRAQVDTLEGQVYIGSLVLQVGDRVTLLDARPSDAIALAIGQKAPIYLSSKLLRRVGFTLDELDLPGEKRGRTVDPVAL